MCEKGKVERGKMLEISVLFFPADDSDFSTEPATLMNFSE
jgi:hypothetical protein